LRGRNKKGGKRTRHLKTLKEGKRGRVWARSIGLKNGRVRDKGESLLVRLGNITSNRRGGGVVGGRKAKPLFFLLKAGTCGRKEGCEKEDLQKTALRAKKFSTNGMF